MKGLLFKEVYSLLEMSNFKITMLFCLVSLVLGATGVMPFMLIFIPIVMAILPRAVITFDENSKWQQFSLVLPYSRRDIVTSKYLITIIVCVGTSLLSAATYTISSFIKGSFNGTELAFIGLLSCALALILPSIAIPLEMRFGTAKAKYLTMLFGGLLGGGGGLLAGMTGTDMISKLSFTGLSAGVLPAVVFAAALVIYFISWIIAVKLYETREF